MRNSEPLFSTRRIADLFEHSRGTIVTIMILISLVAVYGLFHVPTADDEAAAASAAPQFDRSDNAPNTDTQAGDSANPTPPPVPPREFQQDTTECLLVVEVGDVFAPESAAAIRDVVQAVERLPQVARVFWLDRVPSLNMFGLAEPLLPQNTASASRFAAAKQKAMQHPLARGQLISADGTTLLMPVWLDWIHVTKDEQTTNAILTAARQAASEHQVEMLIRLTGRVPLYIGAQEALNRNHLKFQIIGYTLVLVLAIVLFRGWTAVVIVAGAPALGIFWSHGWLKLMDQLDNPLTGAVLPVLVSMVGFTDGVHLIVHIRAARAAGASPMEAAKSAIQKVGLACMLTSLTTAIGFSSLMLASNEYVQGFGQACAIGVLLTFIAVITFIPIASTTRLGRDIHIGHEHDFVRNNLERLAPFIDVVIARKRSLAALGFVVTIALLAWAYTSLRPDDRLSDSQPSGSEAYQALAHCDDVFGGIETIHVRVYWSQSRAADSAGILAAIAEAQAVLANESLVHNQLSIHDFLDQLPGASNTLARSSCLALLPEAIQENYFNKRKRQAVVTGRIQDKGIATFEPVFSRIELRLAELRKEHKGFNFLLQGTPVRRGRELYRIVVDLTTSLGTASITILIVMALVYRSFTIGLITIVPNIFPLVVTAAFLIMIGQPLEIASVCSFTVCLGIAVDDSIHFLSRYKDERREGKRPKEAVRATFIGVGTALITTTIVLIAGFGTVLTSDLPGHRTFASMACWTIGAALVGDLVFLPALLLCFDRDDQPAEEDNNV